MPQPLTATMTTYQPLGAMIYTLQTMQDTTLILTLLIVNSTASPIATIISGLDHDTDNIFAQMSWRFIMKCLLETWRNKTQRNLPFSPPPPQKKNNNNNNNNGNNKQTSKK